MKMKKYLSSVIMLIGCFLILGWGDDWAQIKKTAEGIKSINAEFIQKKHMKILSKPLISKGKFYYAMPKSLRWEYFSPIKSIMLMDNGKIKRYVKGSSGFVEDSSAGIQSMQIVMQEISMWFKGEFNQNPNFTASLKNRKIILNPKEKEFTKFIKRIELHLSARPGVIESVIIYESEKNYTIIEFKNVILNENINNSLFQKI